MRFLGLRVGLAVAMLVVSTSLTFQVQDLLACTTYSGCQGPPPLCASGLCNGGKTCATDPNNGERCCCQ